MMKREIVITKDGSPTLSIPGMQVTYHSLHGALQESTHVFIRNGLHYALDKFRGVEINVFEMGFGTGLNAWLTAKEAATFQRRICYTTIEQFPLTLQDVIQLRYAAEQDALFMQLHEQSWNMPGWINAHFMLQKVQEDLTTFATTLTFQLIYYDAFAPAAQPELWTEAIFRRLYDILVPDGILVTYCAKGDVRRAMQAAGFHITKLAGPPGKREMIRAEKNCEVDH